MICRTVATAVVCAALSSFAQAGPEARIAVVEPEETWQDNARFFGGIRIGVGVPPGTRGLAPTLGAELGVSSRHGVGFGLHLITMSNPPALPALGIPKADYGFGAAADVRMYFQTLDPLTLYATLSAGFIAGPGHAGADNAVLPLLNPGFGARVKLGSAYVAFEFGFAGFFIPFINVSVGYEPDRPPRAAAVSAPLPPPIATPVPCPTAPPAPPAEPAPDSAS